MPTLVDRVVETTQTTGTGTLDLDGAVSGYRAFSEDLAATTDKSTYYLIEDDPAAPTQWEYGIGTWTAGSPNVLTRDTVLDSSSGGSKISLLAGTTYTVTGAVTSRSLAEATALPGYLFGLTLSNNASDANNDVDIAAGEATSDGTPRARLSLASSLTKRLDSPWAVGNNQGGLDTGSKASSTWYHVHLISNGATVDALFSTSATSPTMPSGYTARRRIGTVRTDASGNIRAFRQFGDRFEWNVTLVDLNSTVVVPTPTLYTLTVPLGITVLALIQGLVSHATLAPSVHVYRPGASVDNNAPTARVIGTALTAYAASVTTNTSAQVEVSSSATSTTLTIGTNGWVDTRGRLA